MQDKELTRLTQAVEGVVSENMSYRAAAAKFGVAKSKIARRITGEVELEPKNGPSPTLTPREIQCISATVIDRTTHAQCFTMDEIAGFICRVVFESPERSIFENFPSQRFVQRFIKTHKDIFGRRTARGLDESRAKASTEANVTSHYNNLAAAFAEAGSIPPSQIWNLGSKKINWPFQ